ncbi:MAG: DNA polymerase I [Patescibacteria group bacterium]|jgi:DNA polymerase-1|nr:DNA polymerase I [Patescibacteria group bacterium]
MKTLVLIDSHALIHRCYHALPNLTTPKNEPIGAVYGTIRILFKIIKELKPDYLAACFDLAEPTFRHKEYKEYKAKRPKTDEALISQFQKIKEFFEKAKIKYFELPGYEADDLIGTLVKKFSAEKDLKIIILTGDLDTLQLVQNDKVVVYTMKKGIQDTIIYNEDLVKQRYEGLVPAQLVDFKALKGDPSDNILGVKGIGEKTAIELIKNFSSLENLYQEIEKEDFTQSEKAKIIKPKILSLLLEQKEGAFFSKYLATLNCEAPIEIQNLEELKFNDIDKEKVMPLFHEWKFESLINQLKNSGEQSKEKLANSIEFSTTSTINWLPLKKILSSSPNEIFIFFENNELEIFDGTSFFKGSIDVLDFDLSRYLKEKVIIGYDLKNLIKTLGLFNQVGLYDIKVAQWLINSEIKDYSLQKIWHNLFKQPLPPINNLEVVQKIYEKQREKINELGLKKVFSEIEMPLIPVLAQMENYGIKIDVDHFKKLNNEVENEIQKITQQIFAITQKEFNLNSPKQLSDILFNHLKITNKKLSKTSTGLLSTREEELIKLKDVHPIISLILQHRELMKLKTTYLEPLPLMVDKNSRLHTTYNQTGTATGRLSSENPNLQNIPIESEWAKKIRKGFVAEKGHLFLGFDYSQIELRIAASLSDDPKMKKVFWENGDIHTITAAEINNTSPDKVTAEMRRQAKTLNFGVLYGMGAKAFSETAGISKEEAKKFIDEYYHDFANIRQWQINILAEAQQTGCVKTLTGRIRWVYDLISGNQKYRSLAERAAINFPIQGLAADIIKNAMIQIHQFILKNNLENDVRLLLQIHDELIFEVREEKIETIKNEIQKIMEQNNWLSVPLQVQSSIGKTLADLK